MHFFPLQVLGKVEPFVSSCTALPAAPHMANLHALVEGMRQACASKEPAVVAALVKRAVESILEGLTPQANQVRNPQLVDRGH